MSLDFFTVVSNLISLFSLIAVGYIAARTGAIKQEASPYFSAVLMKITLPCTIFISLVTREYDPGFVRDGIIIIAAGTVSFIAMLYIGRWLAEITGVPEGRRGVWAFVSAYSNSGFMGFPIALALFGFEGLALSVMLNISFNITIYTLGALEIIRDTPNHGSEGIDMKSIIFSNINIATAVSFVFYFGGISLPPSIALSLNHLSGITTPLSMIIIGMALARSKVSDLFTDRHAWSAAAMRLIIYPSVLCGIVKAFPLSENPLVGAVFILINCMPGASVTAVLSEMYGADSDFAARALFIQNIFCVATIPIMCMMI